MARKIAFINYKGGVGKTSLIVNTAACLARMGHRVLLCDFDTQSNASIWLLRLDRWNEINSTGVGAVYSIFDPGKVKVADLIVKDVIEDRAGGKSLPGLDLLPTAFNLVDLEADYAGEGGRPAYLVFYEQLAAVEKDYDYILFDCPPNILRASQCGIFSANEIYVPCNPDALSLIGFTLLVEKLGRFHQLSASFRKVTMGPTAQVQGLVMNAIKTGVDIEVPRMRLQLRLNQFKASRRAGKNARILDGFVRDAMVVRRAVALGLPVNLLSQESDQIDNVVRDYERVAQEIIRFSPGEPAA
jgi:chromosome partitioning protein